MLKALITTVPFGDKNRTPIDLLESSGIDYLINPLNKKLTEDELSEMVQDFDVIIAGTEKISSKVMDKAPKLKMISRVGIGLDGVDLLAAEERGISVSYTPDAPTSAVAELTIGLMLSLLRSTHVSNSNMHEGSWLRIFGRRLAEVKIGIIGVGRVGTTLLNHFKGFDIGEVLVNDIEPNISLNDKFNINWVDKNKIYQDADLISIHTPLTSKTNNMIQRKQLLSMKKDAILINTARGGIINEHDLYDVMLKGHLSGVAIDVFNQEPYNGKLAEIKRCLLTSHMGSMSIDCRTNMEIEATKEVIRFFKSESLKNRVPHDEYEMQR
jgi:D-3-phosphoglycerate dehydrogenase / 2-oxoglutarate reductase